MNKAIKRQPEPLFRELTPALYEMFLQFAVEDAIEHMKESINSFRTSHGYEPHEWDRMQSWVNSLAAYKMIRRKLGKAPDHRARLVAAYDIGPRKERK